MEQKSGLQIILLLFSISIFPIFSQHTVHMRNGKRISGNIKDQNINFVMIQSDYGKLHKLSKKTIKKITFSYDKKEALSGITSRQKPGKIKHRKKRSFQEKEKSLLRIRKLQAKQKELRIEEERKRNLELLFEEKQRLKQAKEEEKIESEEEEFYYEENPPQKMLSHNDKTKPNKINPIQKLK